jgi:hypothetical protein
LREHGVGGPPPPTMPGSLPTDVIDCPDGLARCNQGHVETSRLAVVARDCRGPEDACTCPWDPAGVCRNGCAADGLELVMERAMALAQLCAMIPDAGPVGVEAKGPIQSTCEEGQLYRCVAGAVVDCVTQWIVGSCVRGCVAPGASIDDDGIPVRREAAFAILCSR